MLEWPRWVNGIASTQVSLSERALQFGDGVFETMHVSGGDIHLRRYHRDRLVSGIERLAIGADTEAIFASLDRFVKALPDSEAVIKLIVSRGQTSRGYFAPKNLAPSYLMQSSAVPEPRCVLTGSPLYFCRTQLASSPLLAGIKHLNRLEQVMARQEWQDDCFVDGLMCDYQGHPIEGVMSNVFWVSGDSLFTPSLDFCGVLGVARQYLLDEVLPELGYRCHEGVFCMEDVHAADEIFVCNSIFGCVPINNFAGRTLVPGPITQNIIKRWEQSIAA